MSFYKILHQTARFDVLSKKTFGVASSCSGLTCSRSFGMLAKYASLSCSPVPNKMGMFQTAPQFTEMRRTFMDSNSTKGSLEASKDLSNLLSPPVSETVYLSEPPPPLDPGLVADVVLNKLGEPTLSSLGLGSYWPSGGVQTLLELFHVHLDLPWWGSIVACTLLVRLAMFPLYVKIRRETLMMVNHMPTMIAMQQKMKSAADAQNIQEVERLRTEYFQFMMRNNVNPMKAYGFIFLQAPVFLSFYFGLRGMANLPVESMKTGGTLWFPDLTTPDTLFLLPLISMSTLLIMMELGAEGPQNKATPAKMKWILRGLPVLTFFFILKFPAAMTFYWMTSNFFSLGQSVFLRQPKVKKYFSIPDQVDHNMSWTTQNKSNKDFKTGFKESMDFFKVLEELETRQRLDSRPKPPVQNPTSQGRKRVITTRTVTSDKIKSKTKVSSKD